MAVTLLGVPLISAGAAHGDPIGDLQARATEIAAQISQLQAQIEEDSNAWEAARYRVSQLEGQIADSQAAVEQAKQDEAAKRKQLSAYAINAYMAGGDGTDLSAMLDDSADKLDQRQGYARSAVGDRQSLVDELAASQKNTQDKIAALNDDKAEAQASQEQADAKRKSAQAAADRLQALQGQVQGELAEAVRQKQAAEARAQQQRAYEQAQEQARLQAQQARATEQARPVPAPAPSASDSSSSTEQAPVSIPSNGSVASIAIAAAESQLGVPYVWGGASPGGGFDCSGLTMWAYAQAGVGLPHYTGAQEQVGRVVPLSAIQPGDLVFYWGGGHVALYIGGGSVIHAPHTGDVVRYGSLYMGTPELVVRPYA